MQTKLFVQSCLTLTFSFLNVLYGNVPFSYNSESTVNYNVILRITCYRHSTEYSEYLVFNFDISPQMSAAFFSVTITLIKMCQISL